MAVSESELLRLVMDQKEGDQLRASALVVLLGEVPSMPDLEAAARRRQLDQYYAEFNATLPAILEKPRSNWQLKAERQRDVEARIRERIRRDAQIWIIHGGKSTVWQSLATFLVTDLELRYTEFNDPAAKRVFIQDRVETMVASSTLALAVMTAADVTECGERRARQNVVHEIGVAQGRLGFGRVIIMLQRGVETFSNMSGLVYVPFEPSKLAEALSDLRSHIVARLGI